MNKTIKINQDELYDRAQLEDILNQYLSSGCKLIKDWDYEYWRNTMTYRAIIDCPSDPSFLLF